MIQTYNILQKAMSQNISFLISRTIEYMSPEVMDLSHVNPAADMWGVGCITFQLLSGGISPFFANNRYRTMAKVLDCDYSLEQAELSKTSTEAKDFISLLLIKVIKHNKKQESHQITIMVITLFTTTNIFLPHSIVGP